MKEGHRKMAFFIVSFGNIKIFYYIWVTISVIMETFKGACFTNLDDYNCPVKEFARVPNIGERVMVIYKGRESSLAIVQITHQLRDEKPFLRIELHN